MQIAIEQLYRQHHESLLRYLTRQTRCSIRAEDLAQAVWLRLLAAHERRESLPESDGSFRAYLFAAARNLFIDEYTRKHGLARTRLVDPGDLESLCPADLSAAPDDGAEQAQLQALVRQAVAALPQEQRRVVLMWVEGRSIAEMAQSSEAPVNTVLSRKKYGFAKLKLDLQAAAV
jgi:RNA polymerase sigma factor (sigma-70 family)